MIQQLQRYFSERDAEGVVPNMVCENKRKYTIWKICLIADENFRGQDKCGRPQVAPTHTLWGYRTVLSPWVRFFDGRTVFAPTVGCVAIGTFFVFFIQFSSCKRGAGSAFLCDQNLSSCSPNSRPQNVSSYTATSQDIRFGIIPLYLSRKRGGLLHKKCNN